jgi:multidrug efflux pump subunit AcrA (membrane-fusion protein)
MALLVESAKRGIKIMTDHPENTQEQLGFDRERLTQQAAKIKLYAQALKGKELQLRKKEEELKQREIQLKLYRKNILLSIKEQLLEKNVSYEDQVKILQKYKDILQDIAKDIQDDLDEIMG